VALSYRGYGGSSGHPTEKRLIEDAKAAYAFSVARERLVLWGEIALAHRPWAAAKMHGSATVSAN
jgi:hypothetical protein